MASNISKALFDQTKTSVEQILAMTSAQLKIASDEIDALQGYDGQIPQRTSYKSLRNIAGHSSYGKSRQGGTNTTYYARQVVPIYDDLKQGQVVKILYSKTSSYLENSAGGNTLNNCLCQIGLEYPPLSGTITPARFDNGTNITKTFGDDASDELLDWTVPMDIKAGSFVFVHLYQKNAIMLAESGDINRKRITTAASGFIGDVFRRTTDASSFNNNSLALFTDTANGITAGMSDATRNAITCDLLQVNGSYWHFGIVGILADSYVTSILSVGDSTDAKAGSSSSNVTDDSYTYGIAGRTLGRRFPIMSASGANDALFRWIDFPNNCIVRKTRAQYCTHIAVPMGRNDIPAYASDASIPNMITKYDAWFALPEFSTKPLITYTVPPFNSSTSASADGMTTLANSFSSSANNARKEHNRYMRNHPRSIKCFDLDKLFRDPRASDKLMVYPYGRQVTGTVAAGSNILDLTSGEFYTHENGIKVMNANLGGTGTQWRNKLRIISSNKALMSSTASVAITNEPFFVGAYHWVNSPTDFIHMSPEYYNALYTIGEKGLFMEGMSVFQPNFGVI